MSEERLPSLEDSPFWHPYTSIPFNGPRTRFVSASGAHVVDENGRSYFDATSSWWCITLGHCHPRLVEALRRQAGTLDQVMVAPHSHRLVEELSERLLSLLGGSYKKVFFSDDGSTAVEAALKMAIQYWGNRGEKKRTRFVSVDRGYHGDTMGAVSVSQVSEFQASFDSVRTRPTAATTPYCYRCPLKLEYPTCGIKCLESLAEELKNNGSEYAAVIVEPLVLGAGGMITYPKEYLEELVGLCRRHGLLVIFDEVFTGFGRTGTMFAMEQIVGRPDIICLSKGLTAGMLPLAATVVTQEVFKEFVGQKEKTFFHGHTYTANPLGCAVALENLNVFSEEGVVDRNRGIQDLMAIATPRFQALDHVGEVRHLGLVWAIELVEAKAGRVAPNPLNGPGWKIARALWEKGIWIRPLHNTVYLIPPYCSSREELQLFFDLLYSEIQNGSAFEDGSLPLG